jgi:glycosyltransferase involved in cell wall biosynthesis
MNEIGYCIKKHKIVNKFNIVIPTYNSNPMLDVIINCFLSQDSDNWNITVVSDGHDDNLSKFVERYQQDNIAFYVLHKRYNDWGHTPREYGIYQSDCEYTIMTGFDNYYVPTFIKEFDNATKIFPNVDMVFCDFVLNHIRDGLPYNGHIESKLEVNFIDIGNFATKTSLLKEVGFKWRNFAADWSLVEELKIKIPERNGNVVKIPQTLYVHN